MVGFGQEWVDIPLRLYRLAVILSNNMPTDTGDGWETMRREQDEETNENYHRYELLAWVKASDHRKDILTSLQEGPENTTYFKEKWDVATADVPRKYINELQSRGLVECLTPERQRYRLYGLTNAGEELLKRCRLVTG